MSEASVVDLPLPVGPVTSTRPRCFLTMSTTLSGMPSESGVGISKFRMRTRRHAAPLQKNVDAEAPRFGSE
jgi:hypothetical protein